MYSARDRGENPFQHACLEVRSGRRLGKREVMCSGLRRLLGTHYRDRKKNGILAFALLSLMKLQMKCGSFFKFQEELWYYDPFP